MRVGIWGLGGHVERNLVPAFERSDRTVLVAMHTRDESRLSDLARRTGARAHAAPQGLLHDSSVEAVYLATPTGLHYSMGLEVLAAGKHLWVEKPATTGFENTRSLIEDAARQRLVVLETDMFLHHPQLGRVREILDDADTGRIFSVAARFGFPHRSGDDFRYRADLGGGALLDVGFYPVAAAVALLGNDVQVRGAGLGAAPNAAVDTWGSALLAADDQHAVLEWGYGRSYRSEIDVWCENGVVGVKRAFTKPFDLETEIELSPQAGSARSYAVPAGDHFALMLDHFAAVGSREERYEPASILARARILSEIRAAAK